MYLVSSCCYCCKKVGEFFVFLSVYSFTMFYNFLAAFAMLVDDAEPLHEGATFGLSILYLVVNVPASFLGWYRPAYNGLK